MTEDQKTEMAAVKDELNAMQQIAEVLVPLSPEGRRRALAAAWLVQVATDEQVSRVYDFMTAQLHATRDAGVLK